MSYCWACLPEIARGLTIEYWAWFGTLYLAWLAIQDTRYLFFPVYEPMKVDDRKNYFMFGVTFSLLSHISRPFYYILGVALTNGVIMPILARLGSSKADTKAFLWAGLGFGLINPMFIVLWLAIYTTALLIYKLAVFPLFKVKKAPFFPAILLGFVLLCASLRLY